MIKKIILIVITITINKIELKNDKKELEKDDIREMF